MGGRGTMPRGSSDNTCCIVCVGGVMLFFMVNTYLNVNDAPPPIDSRYHDRIPSEEELRMEAVQRRHIASDSIIDSIASAAKDLDRVEHQMETINREVLPNGTHVIP